MGQGVDWELIGKRFSAWGLPSGDLMAEVVEDGMVFRVAWEGEKVRGA